ncbi:hypothetical protein AB3M89_13550 [Microbacterium sp. 179-I 3D2 NHS]|uniref:hypothetical protein n=1 Tax=Microbacterium sp. 179-I 3D2 NHS TaxID=3235178 RepID=UPI00399FBF1C
MMTDQTTDPRILAGEFVLADADGDTVKAQTVLARVGAGEVTTVAFLTALSRMAAEMLQAVAGDHWRDDLRTALLAIDVEAVTRNVDE